MKKILEVLLLVGLGCSVMIGLGGCKEGADNEGPAEEVGKTLDEAGQEAGEAIGDAAEELGDEMEDASEEIDREADQ